ncbi:natural killer cells antigen CD94 [Heterocephalus glaber]|uniref:Natural killer cells antigen CD94 n=1 Tax=Heterocephalus glaber TaxID=10181 RepID=A0AAX6SYR8_HETGA|nr:natural killer cells antigen CD94 [Heterocephalus glaber]
MKKRRKLLPVSDCCSCQEKWIGYQCNCYFISDERKTWEESSQLCASHNSSLLQLQNSDELVFMNTNPKFYWMGLSSAKECAAWLWEDGSALSQNLLPLLPTPSPGYCIAYSPRKVTTSELCGIKNHYMCKQRPI